MYVDAQQLDDRIRQYCDDVLSDVVPSGRLVKLACERHLLDLKNAGERGFYFDIEKATRGCSFFPAALRHSKGKWAGKPFELTDSQTFVTAMLDGWRREEDKYRRFTRALIEVARKWGKSEYASGQALKLGTFDEPFEPGADVYLCATKEDQVRKTTFKQCCNMVNRSPSLSSRLKVQTNAIIAGPTDPYQPNSYIYPIGSDSATSDGFDVHGAILDEIHAWMKHHQGLYDKMTTADGARDQPLVAFFTTAGNDKSELWIRIRAFFVRCLESVLTGNVVSDEHFAFIACADETDKPFALYESGDNEELEKVVRKANPNYPTTPTKRYVKTRMSEGVDDPLERNKVIRFLFNCKVSSNVNPIDAKLWADAEKAYAEFDHSQEWTRHHGAFDVGRSDDFAAFATCKQYGNDESCIYVLRGTSFTVSERSKELPADLRAWIDSGELIEQKGEVLDFGLFQDAVVSVPGVQTWAFDPTFALQMAQNMQVLLGDDVPVKFIQSAAHYNEPCRKFVKALKAGRVLVEPNACNYWQAKNVTFKANARDEWMPDKGIGPEFKIDVMVAKIMAFAECLFSTTCSQPYEQGSMF